MVSASPIASLPIGLAIVLPGPVRPVLPLAASGCNPERLPAVLPPKPQAATLAAWRPGNAGRAALPWQEHELREKRRYRQGSDVAALTPASPADLPPLGELVADEPFWRYPAEGLGRESIAHLRVWLTAGPETGHLAVVTKTGAAAPVMESAGRIWAELARRYGPSLVLLEHYPAPEFGEGMETLDLVRVGADGSPRWTRVWPTRRAVPVTRVWSCG
jgi:hypothetical protein